MLGAARGWFGGFTVVLDDLHAAGAELGRASDALDEDRGLAVIASLARLHAKFWGDDARLARCGLSVPWQENVLGAAVGAQQPADGR